MASDVPIVCPECKHEFCTSPVAFVPDDQKLTMRLTSESKWFSADGLGEVIRAQSKILKQVARSLGVKVCVFVGGIRMKECEVEIDFFVTTVREV